MEITRRFLLGHGVKASFLLPAAGAVLARPSAGQPAAAGLETARARRTAPQRPGPARPLPLVMLDPGHGGKDPGAIGYSGTYEKQIALATAQELQRMLVASGRYRVRLTRPRDVFIRLEDRVAIAQEADATLFVSMHADSLPDTGVRGASVYTLADTASDAQTAALARRENNADRFAGPAFQGVSPDVARILASLVRQEARVGSVRMQRSVVDALETSLPMLPSPARHASFVVLKAANIPSVLVEMGFMSNPRDEAALRQASHRVLVAQAMQRAVDAWFASTDYLTQANG
jgi:N-acetylmuramoyl-L-alanine amidase